MKKILITGGAGFIGSHVVRFFINNYPEYKIYNLDNLSYAGNLENLKVEVIGRGFAWLDTGTHESLLEASNYIQAIENRQGLKVACVKEIAYEMGYITSTQLLQLAKLLLKNGYGRYLINRVKRDNEVY